MWSSRLVDMKFVNLCVMYRIFEPRCVKFGDLESYISAMLRFSLLSSGLPGKFCGSWSVEMSQDL